MIRSRDSKAMSRQSGFTMVELAVALGVTAIVMLGILFLFDFNNKLTRVQSNVADMQQSLRIAQYDMVRMTRMAGRGGLNAAQGVVITRDVGDNAYLNPDDPDLDYKILPGTDVLTVRGVFSTPIFQVSYTNPLSLQLAGGIANPPTPATAERGIVEICKLSPSGKEQDFEIIEDQLTRAEALILVSPLDDRFYTVVELVPIPPNTPPPPATSCPAAGPLAGGIQLAFNIVRSAPYSDLSAPLAQAQLALEKVAYVGFLEEYRFYVQEGRAIEGDTESDLTPVLSRARFYPGTNNFYVGKDNLRQDIADGILDLQIAMGFDANDDGQLIEDLASPGTDEWFGNFAGEAPVTGDFKGLRISTLVRTRRPDNTYEAPVLPSVEDHVYDADDPVNTVVARKYRRRLLQTIVNLRNLTT